MIAEIAGIGAEENNRRGVYSYEECCGRYLGEILGYSEIGKISIIGLPIIFRYGNIGKESRRNNR